MPDLIKLADLDPALAGYAIDAGPRGIYVPVIISGEERKGHVGRLIEWLKSKYAIVKFPNVLNPILAGMLERRGFSTQMEYAPEFEEYVKVWTWRREA